MTQPIKNQRVAYRGADFDFEQSFFTENNDDRQPVDLNQYDDIILSGYNGYGERSFQKSLQTGEISIAGADGNEVITQLDETETAALELHIYFYDLFFIKDGWTSVQEKGNLYMADASSDAPDVETVTGIVVKQSTAPL